MISCLKCGKSMPYNLKACGHCGFQFPEMVASLSRKFGDEYSGFGDFVIVLAGFSSFVGGLLGLLLSVFMVVAQGNLLMGGLAMLSSFASLGFGVAMFRLMDAIRCLQGMTDGRVRHELNTP